MSLVIGACRSALPFAVPIETVTATTQLLLKEEWEKVKQEAEHGNLKPERSVRR